MLCTISGRPADLRVMEALDPTVDFTWSSTCCSSLPGIQCKNGSEHINRVIQYLWKPMLQLSIAPCGIMTKCTALNRIQTLKHAVSHLTEHNCQSPSSPRSSSPHTPIIPPPTLTSYPHHSPLSLTSHHHQSYLAQHFMTIIFALMAFLCYPVSYYSYSLVWPDYVVIPLLPYPYHPLNIITPSTSSSPKPHGPLLLTRQPHLMHPHHPHPHPLINLIIHNLPYIIFPLIFITSSSPPPTSIILIPLKLTIQIETKPEIYSYLRFRLWSYLSLTLWRHLVSTLVNIWLMWWTCSIVRMPSLRLSVVTGRCSTRCPNNTLLSWKAQYIQILNHTWFYTTYNFESHIFHNRFLLSNTKMLDGQLRRTGVTFLT